MVENVEAIPYITLLKTRIPVKPDATGMGSNPGDYKWHEMGWIPAPH